MVAASILAVCPLSRTQATPLGNATDVISAPQTSVSSPIQKHHPIPLAPEPLWADMRYLAGQPDFWVVVGVVGLAPAIFHKAYATEQPVINDMWKNSPTADRVFEFGAPLGEATYSVIAGLGGYFAGRYANSPRLEAFGGDLFRAQVLNGLVTIGMKGAWNRTRPDGGPYSYPSGHTSVAFATAAVVYDHFGPYWGVPALLTSTYVGLSRLQENKHYLSDVVAGAVIGGYIGFKVSGHRNRQTGIHAAPVAGEVNGLAVRMEF